MSMFGLPFHHIGIACQDIERAAEFVKRTYVIHSDSGTVFDPLQKAHLRLFNDGEPGAIELISGDTVSQFLKNQSTYYHVCFLTKDLAATIAKACSTGSILASGPKPALLFAMRKVAFIYTPIGLVEFLEE
jgi:methylmalonyl-CoA/ethylmalonyl-CoA epimerase